MSPLPDWAVPLCYAVAAVAAALTIPRVENFLLPQFGERLSKRLGGIDPLCFDHLGHDCLNRHCLFVGVRDGAVQRSGLLTTAGHVDLPRPGYLALDRDVHGDLSLRDWSDAMGGPRRLPQGALAERMAGDGLDAGKRGHVRGFDTAYRLAAGKPHAGFHQQPWQTGHRSDVSAAGDTAEPASARGVRAALQHLAHKSTIVIGIRCAI
jgi:hypothetical protein